MVTVVGAIAWPIATSASPRTIVIRPDRCKKVTIDTGVGEFHLTCDFGFDRGRRTRVVRCLGGWFCACCCRRRLFGACCCSVGGSVLALSTSVGRCLLLSRWVVRACCCRRRLFGTSGGGRFWRSRLRRQRKGRRGFRLTVDVVCPRDRRRGERPVCSTSSAASRDSAAPSWSS